MSGFMPIPPFLLSLYPPSPPPQREMALLGGYQQYITKQLPNTGYELLTWICHYSQLFKDCHKKLVDEDPWGVKKIWTSLSCLPRHNSIYTPSTSTMILKRGRRTWVQVMWKKTSSGHVEPGVNTASSLSSTLNSPGRLPYPTLLLVKCHVFRITSLFPVGVLIG